MKKTALLLLLALSACATKPPVVTAPTVPLVLRSCSPMPKVPVFNDQRTVAKYVLRLWTNDLDCHNTMSSAMLSIGE